MSKNKIVYLRWGDRYTQDHVNHLYDQVNKNCSVPFDFITMDVSVGQAFDQLQQIQENTFRGTQDPESSITDNELQSYIREDAGGFAHFRKYIMFMRDENNGINEDDTLLYLDLDTLITGDLSYFFDLDMSKPWIARSWQFNPKQKWQRLYHLRSCPYYNSSVVLWKPGQCRRIFNEMMRDPEAAFYMYGINDNWLFHRFGPYAYSSEHKNWFQNFDRDIVVSDEKYFSENTIIHTLAGLSMKEKNEICLR
jgi:hypothetical protein